MDSHTSSKLANNTSVSSPACKLQDVSMTGYMPWTGRFLLWGPGEGPAGLSITQCSTVPAAHGNSWDNIAHAHVWPVAACPHI